MPDAVLAQALSDSKSPADAAARLSALGVLASQEAAFAASREDEFRVLLTRVWRKTSSSIPAPFPVDDSFPVPALTVVRDGVTFFVHGVAHGQLGAPRRGAVLSVVRRAVAAGEAVYSEQNLPAHYGYAAGLETLDHSSPVRVVPAAPGYSPLTLLLKRAIDWAVAPGAFLAAAAWLLASPASPFAWLLLPLTGALAFFVLSGGLPLMAWKRRRLAAGVRAQGLEDLADQYDDEASRFFVSKPDLGVLRGLELPQPLGATSDRFSVRSRAIADAVAYSAAAAGAAAVHVVVGHLHAHEVAARLAAKNVRWTEDARALIGRYDRYTRAAIREDFAAAHAADPVATSSAVKGSALRATMTADDRYAVVWEPAAGGTIIRAVIPTRAPGTIEELRAVVSLETGGRVVL